MIDFCYFLSLELFKFYCHFTEFLKYGLFEKFCFNTMDIIVAKVFIKLIVEKHR